MKQNFKNYKRENNITKEEPEKEETFVDDDEEIIVIKQKYCAEYKRNKFSLPKQLLNF